MSIPWSLHRLTPPVEPVTTVDDLKLHRRVTWAEEDTLIGRFGLAVEEELEKKLSVAFLTQVWVLRLDRFPMCSPGVLDLHAGTIALPRPTVGDTGPFVSLAADAVKYLDGNGTLQTLSASLYTLDAYSYPPRIYPADGQSWPVTDTVPKAVTITYTVGKAEPEEVPSPIWLEIWRAAGDAYEHRENVITGTIVNVLPFSDSVIQQYSCAWEPRYA